MSAALDKAKWGLAEVARLSELEDDQRLQYLENGVNVGELQRNLLAFAQAHALVSIAESLARMAQS